MTPVDIVNIGVLALDRRPIQSFADGSVAANAASATFRVALRAVLEAEPWNDATEMATLAAELTVPQFGYAYQYLLPADALKVQNLWGVQYKWRRKGRRLLTSAPSPLRIFYTRDLTINAAGAPVSDGEDIPIGALLATAVGLRWAAMNAKQITGSEGSMEMARVLYERAIREARGADASEGTVEPARVGNWIDQTAPDAWDAGMLQSWLGE